MRYTDLVERQVDVFIHKVGDVPFQLFPVAFVSAGNGHAQGAVGHGGNFAAQHIVDDPHEVAPFLLIDSPHHAEVDKRDPVAFQQKQIAGEILKEIRTRLKFMLDVGLEYLSLNRQSMTLSGGESQRIRLATQIGSQLVNVLYILDEPSIGLHQKDNRKLIHSLQELRDNGNSVIVVEHDKEMMENADYIVDLGPKAGRKGGEIMAIGKYSDILKSDSLTAQYLTGKKMIAIPAERRVGNGKKISLKGCTVNNLKNVDVDFP